MTLKAKRLGTGVGHWREDLVAGLTTAVLLVPQSMAYALLAGLPPIVGLYASVAPLVAYALVGSSRQLAVGPVAMDSLLTASVVGAVAVSGSERYVELAALLAFGVGLIQAALGVLRGGFLVNFLSRPVVSGFTSAAALVIGVAQLRLLTGVDLPRSPSIAAVLWAQLQRLAEVHLATLGLGLGSIFLLIALKRWAPRWPRALMVVAVGALAAGPLGLAGQGVAVIGEIPAGLPRPRLPAWSASELQALASGAATIALVAFMEGISVASKLAERDRTQVNPNRELLALGLANLSAGVFQGYPVAGGFSRTAVNADAGARSRWAGLITAAAVAVVLSALTGLLQNVPRASLGAIIVVAVGGLIDAREPLRLWRIKRSDLAVLVATFAATLTLGIQQGVVAGVGLSLLLFLVRTTRPHAAVLGRLPGTRVYRNIHRFAEAVPPGGALVLRLDAQLYFGNVNFVRDTLARLEQEQPKPLRAVVLEASGINQLDSSAEQALSDLHQQYRERGIRLLLANVKGPVRDVLKRSGLWQRLGPEGVFYDVHAAIESLSERGEPTADQIRPDSEQPPGSAAAQPAPPSQRPGRAEVDSDATSTGPRRAL